MSHAYLPVPEITLVEGEQATLRVPIIDQDGEPLDLTDLALEAVVLDPDGEEVSVTVTQDQDDPTKLNIATFVLADEETIAGRWKIRYTVDGEPVYPRGHIGYLIMCYDPAEA